LTEDQRIEVTIKFRDIDKRIVGDVDTVLRELYAFFSSIVPVVTLASRITLTVDTEEFLESCQGVFAVTPEDIATVGKIDTLSDKELVLLHLARARFAYLTKKFETDTVRIGDLIDRTRSGAGTIAGRLSELCSEGLAERMGKGEYRATTLGLDHFLNAVVSKVKITQMEA
jgi:hypothetical protein